MTCLVARSAAAGLLLTLSLAAVAGAGEATDQLKRDLPRVLEVLKPPAQRDAIRQVSQDLFDWTEMSRQVLGRYWLERTDAERAQFPKLLGALIDASMTTLAGYRDAQITWIDESIDGPRARVRSQVAASRGRSVTIDFRMIRGDARWLIYDVVLDGASLVGNFRSQFNQVIKTSSYEKLVEKLAEH